MQARDKGLSRRQVLGGLGVLAATGCTTAGRSSALHFPGEVRITAITTSRHAVRHPRKIGRNSCRDHEAGHDEGLVRVQTSAGVEGLGNTLKPEALGKRLDELLEMRGDGLVLKADARRRIGTSAESTLLDIVGKLTGRPAYELLGRVVRREVSCYDGSIYMRELDDGDSAIATDVKNGLDAGHRAFKVKIGRGNWLKDRTRGYDRDQWALRIVRETAGADAQILVDANNYYSIEESLRLVRDMTSDPFYWMEEMFDECQANHANYRSLRAAIRELKLPTLLADGESGRGEGDLLDLIKEQVIQVSQPDIRTLGIFGFCEYARRIEPFGGLVGPHSCAQQIGVLECCLMGMVTPNFAMVEDCRLTSEVVKLPGWHIRTGRMTPPATPGMGIAIDEEAYRKFCAPEAKTVKA